MRCPPGVNSATEGIVGITDLVGIKISDAGFYRILRRIGMNHVQVENSYNFQRPHVTFQEKAPYEALREKLG